MDPKCPKAQTLHIIQHNKLHATIKNLIRDLSNSKTTKSPPNSRTLPLAYLRVESQGLSEFTSGEVFVSFPLRIRSRSHVLGTKSRLSIRQILNDLQKPDRVCYLGLKRNQSSFRRKRRWLLLGGIGATGERNLEARRLNLRDFPECFRKSFA